MSDVSLDIHRTIILCQDGQVFQMRIRHSHQRHVTDDSRRCPVVVVVEITARELCDDTHGQLLLLLFLV